MFALKILTSEHLLSYTGVAWLLNIQDFSYKPLEYEFLEKMCPSKPPFNILNTIIKLT